MGIPQPFIPVSAETEGLRHRLAVLGRTYVFGANGLVESLTVEGEELLAAPMRIVAREDNEPAQWDEDYEHNENESFILSRDDEQVTLCGAMQTPRFVVNTRTRVEYDGSIGVDLRVMSRGKTVAQAFELEKVKPLRYELNCLWLEVPLRKEICRLYHFHENSGMWLADGSERPRTPLSTGGRLPGCSVAFPFKPLLWIGDDEKGLGWYAEDNRSWQPEDPDRAMELVYEEDTVVLRVRLLDGQPRSWTDDPDTGRWYFPVSFRFGFQVTPVKPFPEQPYLHKAFHLDCGTKITGNYADYLAAENRYDRLQEMGVTTLILHEKWNKIQNWFELSEVTGRQLREICDQCHRRGIKVLTYFGYELSSLSPMWEELRDQVVCINEDGRMDGGWWRVPTQRDYVVCYGSSYADRLVEGICRIMDTYHTDGVYLDGPAYLRSCRNKNHGCGWQDAAGVLHGTYPVLAVRKMFKRLYEAVTERGGHINVHNTGVNFTALPFIHQTWYGENLQVYVNRGIDRDMELDYFRAEYTGRNMGVPVEFIVFENKPHWTFEHALSIALLHGILPRPNDIGEPLALMSRVWKLLDEFPVAQACWKPYWNNGSRTNCEKVKVSYYCYVSPEGKTELLAFVANTSHKPVSGIRVEFDEPVPETGECFGLPAYGHRILRIG